jgi:predicted phosphodiesterase
MKCLVVADLHYSLPQYDWVVNVAEQFDLVIIAGDHLDLSSLVFCAARRKS